MDSGWSLKKLHRLIVTSATYRQSSDVTPELLAKDPDNRLLARGPRFRVDAETGARHRARGQRPAQSADRRPQRISRPRRHSSSSRPASYAPKIVEDRRRARNATAARSTPSASASFPYPMLQAFDAPNGEMSCVRRARSNTPLQALTTLNEPLFVESAQALARAHSARKAATTIATALTYAFRLCHRAHARRRGDRRAARTAGERRAAHRRRLGERQGIWPAQAAALPRGRRHPRSLAAWTAVSRVLLNLDETITKE